MIFLIKMSEMVVSSVPDGAWYRLKWVMLNGHCVRCVCGCGLRLGAQDTSSGIVRLERSSPS